MPAFKNNNKTSTPDDYPHLSWLHEVESTTTTHWLLSYMIVHVLMIHCSG